MADYCVVYDVGCLLGLIRARARSIVLTALLGAAIVVGVVVCLPDVYTAHSRVLPPGEGYGSGMKAQSGDLGEFAMLMGISPGGSKSDLFASMLRSRTVADRLVDKFDLHKVYGEKSRTKLYRELSGDARISVGKKDQIITISVDSESPKLAADMANAFVDELMRLSVKLNAASVGRERQFLEERLRRVEVDLKRAEEELQAFQAENKTVNLKVQTESAIKSIAELMALKAEKEVSLGVLGEYYNQDHSQVVMAQKEIALLGEKISSLEGSMAGVSGGGRVLPSMSDVPGLALRYSRLFRNLEVQKKLYELMVSRYELARINEAKNTAAFQVLDRAVAPDHKSKPYRSLIVGLGFLLSLALSLAAHLCWDIAQGRWAGSGPEGQA